MQFPYIFKHVPIYCTKSLTIQLIITLAETKASKLNSVCVVVFYLILCYVQQYLKEISRDYEMYVVRKYSTALEQVLLARQVHVSVVIVVTLTTIIRTGVSGYPLSQHIHVAQHPDNAIRYNQHFGDFLYHLKHPQDNTDRSSRNIGRYTLMKVLHHYLHTPLHLDYLRHVKSPKIRLPATMEKAQHSSEILRKQ